MLASETMSNYIELDKISSLEDSTDLVVQTTMVGMGYLKDEDILCDYSFENLPIVYDLIYKPKYTKMLLRAKDKGCRVINGTDMLIAQGKLQFESFSGYHYPHWVKIDL